jgi:hypothetical protein
MIRLAADGFQYVPVTIDLGQTDSVENAVARFREGLRNRLNACRRATRRWQGAAIWGWFRVTGTASGRISLFARLIARVGPRLGAGDVCDELERTWRLPERVVVSPAVNIDRLPALLEEALADAFADGSWPSMVRLSFRGLRFRYGGPRSRSAMCETYIKPMPVLF